MIKNIESLTSKELSQLKLEHGLRAFLVVVHPYFDTHSEGVNSNKTFSGLLRFSRQKRPIIVFDAKEGIKQTLKDFEQRKMESSPIIFVETVAKNDPTPKVGWQKVIKRLELAGAKKIIVGGKMIEKVALCNIERVIKAKRTLPQGMHVKGLGKDEYYSIDRTVRKALRESMLKKKDFGLCAGWTAAKLKTSGKFKVKTTRRLT